MSKYTAQFYNGVMYGCLPMAAFYLANAVYDIGQPLLFWADMAFTCAMLALFFGMGWARLWLKHY